jgi:conjugative relaxase-like TrwC/TraI family protein
MLGLSGVVGQKDFVALCDNTQPLTGQRLTQRQNHTRTDNAGTEAEREAANRRVFFDFTFSPPKSVSIVALVGGDQRVMQAHREAVKIAVRELERFASTRVRQAGSNSDRATGNIVAALFEHDSSRALDPHLHTHCIVFNATHDAQESRWKALQNYQMLVAQKFVENVYYHELARALGKCGYTVENAAPGDFRVTEVSAELCERFRSGIVKSMSKRGSSSPRILRREAGTSMTFASTWRTSSVRGDSRCRAQPSASTVEGSAFRRGQDTAAALCEQRVQG